MPLPGGASDKYGNRYEGRWTAFCMAQILDEQACSIRLEPPGAEGKGFEFCLNRKDRAEYHQIKRQKSRGGTWTLKNLSSEGILNNFLAILLNDNNYCVFVSTQIAYELYELSDRARRSVSFNEFKTRFLESEEHGSRFDYLCQVWRSREEDAYGLLKRIEIRSIDEDTLQKSLADIIKPLVVGEPMAVAEILANLALDDVHKELSAHYIWQRLENLGFERRVWNKDPHVLNKVSGCTHRNLPADYDSTIAGKWIER